MNSQLMTRAQFAKHRGVQKSAVSNWARADLLVLAEGPGGKLLVDVVRTEAKLNANLDPSRGRPTTAQTAAASEPALPLAAAQPVNNDLSTVRTDLIRAQTAGKQLDNARQAGELVAFAEFERLAIENGRLARERMLALVRNMSERLAAIHDARQIVAVMTEEIDKAFGELAEQMQRGDDGDDTAALEAIENAETEIVSEGGNAAAEA